MSTHTPGRRAVAGIVLAHLLVNLVHGLPHADVPIELALWQNVFVVVVVLAVPLGGLCLAWRGRERAGGAAILVGGLGSALFGTYYHFFSATPDNVANVSGPWSGFFLATSVGISVLAVATVLVGAWLLAEARAATGGRT